MGKQRQKNDEGANATSGIPTDVGDKLLGDAPPLPVNVATSRVWPLAHDTVPYVQSPPVPSVDTKQLRRCVNDLRGFLTTQYSPSDLGTAAGEIIWRAYTFGAFERIDPAFDKLRACLQTQYLNHAGPGSDGSWRLGAFADTVICLAPQYRGESKEWKKALPIIADVIEAEIVCLEAENNANPSKMEHGEPNGGKDAISQTTLWERLKKRAHDNPAIVIFLAIAAVVAVIALIMTSLETIGNFVGRTIEWFRNAGARH